MTINASLRSAGIILLLATMLCSPFNSSYAEEKEPADKAVKRAQRQTKMLDDLYKNAIVLITTHYVDESADLPAGSAFKALFKSMKDSGWHEVRLIDGLGEPIDEANTPRDDFEKAGIKAVLAGAANYEQVETQDGKRVLRTVTSLPMVMQKCILCHENYRDKKIVGGLGYTVPIDED
jgi:hypothetical protein